MGDADMDFYNQPFHAPGDWWIDLKGTVQDILITAGTDEVLVDDIEAFAGKLKVCTIAVEPPVAMDMLIKISESFSKYDCRDRAFRGP